MVDGVSIYDFFAAPNNRFLKCTDILRSNLDRQEIHGDSRHILIEFTGALASVTFYVSHYITCIQFARWL